MEFGWDDAKAARNLRIHGVDFEEARTVFMDPLALVRVDEGHSNEEERFVLVGRSVADRLLVTVFSERQRGIRIISSRRAATREVKEYEEGV